MKEFKKVPTMNGRIEIRDSDNKVVGTCYNDKTADQLVNIFTSQEIRIESMKKQATQNER